MAFSMRLSMISHGILHEVEYDKPYFMVCLYELA